MKKLGKAIKEKRWGDVIASGATPVARAFRMSCIDPATKQLRPESKCNKVRQDLNEHRYQDAIYDRFFSPATTIRKDT